MMKHQLRPSIESLEAKALLSNMAPALIGHHGPIDVPIVTGPIVVNREVANMAPELIGRHGPINVPIVTGPIVVNREVANMAPALIGRHGPIHVPIVTGPIVVNRQVGAGVHIVIGAPASSMELSLTTNHPMYVHGQIVRMTFTETNNTGHNVFVELGPSIDGFSISKAGKAIWRSNARSSSDVIVIRKLAPGAAITLTAAWSASSLNGTFVVHNQLAPNGPSATFEIVTSPPVTLS